ncbi:pyridoxal phosphate-dependent aminotransferase [Robbsia sp. KACC 23696]|uniref:pyridoxal phosphate-dependent aminotransferase n=1 Tax=Robbsia sp. KACC 23696 TaxID=3149231 RepID=UPI00325B0156
MAVIGALSVCRDVTKVRLRAINPVPPMPLVKDSILAVQDSPIIEIWKLAPQRPDVIPLWAGESDLPTPDFISNAAIAALQRGNTFYSTMRGIPPLRAAIARYYKRLSGAEIEDDRIAVTSSGMLAAMLIAQTVVGPGDNVVCVTPSWPNILRAIEVAGGQVRSVSLHSDVTGWSLDLDKLLAACDERTKGIYFASPGNPTGWMIDPEQQRRLLDFARERNIALIADEVYQRIVYDRPFAASLLDICGPDDPVFVINSFSKAWAMTGWRMGWMVYPRALKGTMEKLIQFSVSGGQAFLQEAGIVALDEGEPFVESFVARCKQGREFVLKKLAEMPKVKVVPNAASFYLMLAVEGETDTLEFCKRALLEAGVGLSPGIAFSQESSGQIRICYAKSNTMLESAMERLGNFLASQPG